MIDANPADDYDRRRRERRDAAEGWIASLNRWWLTGQLAMIALFCASLLPLGRAAGTPLVLAEATWGLSLFAAGGSAGVALWSWSSLSRFWSVVGLAPWAIMMMEVTVLAVGLV